MQPRDDGGSNWVKGLSVIFAGVLAALSAVAGVLYVIHLFPQEALGVFGVWLLVYRFVGRWLTNQDSRERALVETVTSVTTGVSLALLTPLFSWPSLAYRFQFLALIGGLFSFCSVWLTSVVASVIIGTSFGALSWQLGLCMEASWAHCGLLTSCAAVFVVVFSLHPRMGPAFLQWLLILLATLLCVESIGPVIPSVSVLTIEELFEVGSCPAEEELTQKAQVTGLAWLLLATLSGCFHWITSRSGSPKDGCENPDLVDSLLTAGASAAAGSSSNAGSGSNDNPDPDGMFNCPNKDGALNRHPVLIKAMFMPEGTDQSHLTDHEKALVEICRKNEDERNRVLYGGGLY